MNTPLPLPENFTLRPAVMADMSDVIHLLNAAAQKYLGHDEFDEEALAAHWQNPQMDMAHSTRVIVTENGRIAGYADIEDSSSLPVRPYLFGRVLPEYENLGLGEALFTWGEQRARDVFTRLPEDVQVSLLASTPDTNQLAQHLLAQKGMRHIRDTWEMEIRFSQPPALPEWPSGISVTTFAQRPDLVALAEAHHNAFQDHWGYVSAPLDSRLERWQNMIEADPMHDPELWFLAVAGETVAGYSLCRYRAYDNPEMGYVMILGVTRPYRQRGLGLALLQYSFNQLYLRGQKGVSLGVDAASLTGATRLYKKAGMTVRHRQMVFSKILRSGRDITTQSAAS